MSDKIRCVIVDDSVFYRAVLVELLERTGRVEVVGSAGSGGYALSLIERLRPELVTLDVEMPGMNGLEVLEQVVERFPSTNAVMVSAPTEKSARTTITALERGAVEFIAKPMSDDSAANERELLGQLKRVAALIETRLIMGPSNRRDAAMPAQERGSGAIELVVVGVSTGGPAALPAMLSQLPATFSLPIVIVQHMPAMFVNVLCESLARKVPLTITEARSGMAIESGRVYLAAGGKQLGVSRDRPGATPKFVLTDDPPENFCRPSIDYTCRSLGDVFGGNVLAVLMTGMGRDGVAGVAELKQGGATVLAQDEASSVVFGIAMEACRSGIVDQIVPLDRLGATINEIIGARGVRARDSG